MIYAETGKWPSRNMEEKVREFIKKFPKLLIKVPDNRALFSEEELKELLPLGKKNLSEEASDYLIGDRSLS
ncbi:MULTISPECIES: hypothetical protein [Listeria]|nr:MULTISPECIES: hypothetical protein [Listeria]